jgi:predicted CoA-substrate-specific enzyme activase
MEHEYGRWPESRWASNQSDWENAKTITAGVDVGTTSAQSAVFIDGALACWANIRIGASFRDAAYNVLEEALIGTGLTIDKIGAIGATGFGRDNAGYATKKLDEVHCHAKGARFMYGPTVTTVVDLGAQTVKAIRLYEWDRVRDITMNDKCATGQGRNLEQISKLLHVPITEIGAKSLDVANDPEPVSTTCYAFAQTETVGQFRPEFRAEKMTENEVYATHMLAIAWRMLGAIGKLQPQDVGEIMVYGDLGFTGGVAKNPGITKRIERELRVNALTSEYDPMLAGAIGAALLV